MPSTAGRHRGQLASRILRRIESDHADPDLSPELVAAQIGKISVNDFSTYVAVDRAIAPEVLQSQDASMVMPPLLGALLKTEQDIELLGKRAKA